MLRQLQLGMTDMALHYGYDPESGDSPFDVERRILSITSMLPPLPENRFLCSFQHIFAGGYSAGYYSYKWAEVLSADAFGAFEDAGLDDENAVAKPGAVFATQCWLREAAVIPWISFEISEAVIRIRTPCSDTAVFSKTLDRFLNAKLILCKLLQKNILMCS
jgi:hypothetical protein